MDHQRPTRSTSTRIGGRPSYANVIATLALFVALGGSAWAVAIGRNDVGSREIAKNAVGSSELKNDKTKGKDIDESSLGPVPRADRADTAGEATHATSADTAVNAQQLGGAGANAFFRLGAPIPSGATVTGVWAGSDFANSVDTSYWEAVTFPARAPVGLTDANVNFADQGFGQPADEDGACTGTVANPTAPAGKVCIYAATVQGDPNSVAGHAIANSALGFEIRAETTAPGFEAQGDGTWAYTAP